MIKLWRLAEPAATVDLPKIIDSDGETVCWFGWESHDGYESGSGEPPSQKNMALILAAPKMLAALAMVIEPGSGASMHREPFRAIDDAIREATGMDPESYASMAANARWKAEAAKATRLEGE